MGLNLKSTKINLSDLSSILEDELFSSAHPTVQRQTPSTSLTSSASGSSSDLFQLALATFQHELIQLK